VISSFTAASTTVAPGGYVLLSWNVSGATSLSINYLGNVTGRTSIDFGLIRTTTFTLTATNASGTTTKDVTVTVSATAPTPTPAPAPTGDTQRPTAPGISSSSATSSTQIDLRWTASTDNVGVTRYSVVRNNTPIASLASNVLNYSDTTVSAGSSYSYQVIAYDAAGNASPPSATVNVTTPGAPAPAPPPTPSSGACPAPATGAFTGCYFNNTSLSGNPAATRTDAAINFLNWFIGPPAPGVNANNYSVRWQGRFNFNAGFYQFSATTGGGMRVYVDNTLVIDRWTDSGDARMLNALAPTTAGSHLVTVEYFETGGGAQATLTWIQR